VTCSKYITCVTLHISDGLLIEISQWNLAPVSGDSVFTVSPASDTTVGFSQSNDNSGTGKYWGYGFAEGFVGPSNNWKFTKSSDGKYSRYGFSVFVT
jgi:hypothetical protein